MRGSTDQTRRTLERGLLWTCVTLLTLQAVLPFAHHILHSNELHAVASSIEDCHESADLTTNGCSVESAEHDCGDDHFAESECRVCAAIQSLGRSLVDPLGSDRSFVGTGTTPNSTLVPHEVVYIELSRSFSSSPRGPPALSIIS